MENNVPQTEHTAPQTENTEPKTENTAVQADAPAPRTEAYTYVTPPTGPTPKKGFAIAGMILGIASVVVGYETWYLGVAAGVVGLVLSLQAKKSYEAIGQKNGMATAGFILSIIGLALSAIGLVACISCGGCLAVAGTSAAMEELAEGGLPDGLASSLNGALGDIAEGLGEAASELAEAATEIAGVI